MSKQTDIKQSHRLKFALVTETVQPEINGVAMTLGKIAKQLSERQHQVQVIRPKQGHTDSPADSEHFNEYLVTGMSIPFYQHLKFGFPAKNRLIKLWANNQPDVVHIATEGASFLMKPIESYLRYFHNQTLATLAPTKKVITELELTGYKNVSLMARGVDTTQFTPSARSPSLRKSWGANDDDLVLIYVGRLAKEKNILLVLEAFRVIQQSQARAKLVFVGDGPLRNALAEACPQAIFSGSQQGHALAEHYASADLFIFPSVTETFGNVVPEALASGLCVVAYDYAAAGEIIEHGLNGLLVPFNQSQDFINTTLNVAQDVKLLHQCRQQAVSSIANIRWDSVIEALESLLYATANGYKQSTSNKHRRIKQRAMRLAQHKKLKPIKS